MSNSVGNVSHAQAQRPEPTPRPKKRAREAATRTGGDRERQQCRESRAARGFRAPGAVRSGAERRQWPGAQATS